MKKLFLHIGLHKTGTTSIQRTLKQNKTALNDQGFEYISELLDETSGTSTTARRWLFNMGDIANEGLHIREPEKFANLLNSSPYNNLILSTEHFSWIFDPEQIALIHKELSAFFDVTVIVYLRRQDKLAVSHFQQASKFRNHSAYSYYGNSFKALPTSRENYDGYLNYEKRLSFWVDSFGAENVICRVFERSELREGDAVADFLGILGVDASQIEVIRENESSGFERTKIGHLVNESGLPGQIANMVRKSADNSGKSLPSREDAEKFYARYRDSNIALNKVLNISSKHDDIFGDDFSSYPEHASDIWTEESANQAIANILNSLKAFKNLNSDELATAASAVSENDPKLAKKLLSIASKLAPKNKSIKKQLRASRQALRNKSD